MTSMVRLISACTLQAAARPGRVAEFDEAFAAGLRHAERVRRTHASWGRRGDRGRGEALAGLLDRESQCCSFFTFGQRAEGDTVTVDVTVPPGHADALAVLAGRAAGHLAGQEPPARP